MIGVISLTLHISQNRNGVSILICIDRRSRTPVYEQIKNEIMCLIRVGVFNPGDKLPSIRAMASETGINVNTVKKAFSELESADVIYSVSGVGSFVSVDALQSENIRSEAFSGVKNAVEAARSRGISLEELTLFIEEIYRTGDDTVD